VAHDRQELRLGAVGGFGGFLGGKQFGLELLAHDGVADGALHQRPVRLTLDQEILRALFDRGHREVAVVEPGQHDDRLHRRRLLHAPDGIETVTVGQGQVEQDHIAGMAGHPVTGAAQGLDMIQYEAVVAGIAKGFADQSGIGGIVFDQQDADFRCGHGLRIRRTTLHGAVRCDGRRCNRMTTPSRRTEARSPRASWVIARHRYGSSVSATSYTTANLTGLGGYLKQDSKDMGDASVSAHFQAAPGEKVARQP
jgi:hypothetical protein